MAMSKTATTGSPEPNGAQVSPPSVEANTPMSVPAYRLFEFAGSTTKAFTGTSGSPLFFAVHVGGLALRFVVFQTCDWLAPVPPRNPLIVTYAVVEVLGSRTVRATYWLGIVFVGSRLWRGLAPDVVPKTPPLLPPTMRTWSFWGEMPMALILPWPAEVVEKVWLTVGLVDPRLTERCSRSVPKYTVLGEPGPSSSG